MSVRELLERAIDELAGPHASRLERSRAKARIVKSNPGILTAAVEEERRGPGPERLERDTAPGIDRDAVVALLGEAIAAGLDPIYLVAQAGAELSEEQKEELLQKLGGGLDTQPSSYVGRCPDCGAGVQNSLTGKCPACGARLPAQKSARPLHAMVDQAVFDTLGRAPLSKLEYVRVKKQILDGQPGLGQAIRDEESAARRAGWEG